jgi:hypothetical protein
MQFHYDSFDPADGYVAPSYKSDPFLSNKSIAMINAKFQNKTRQGGLPKSIDNALEESKKTFRDNMPDIRSLFIGVPGEWDVQGAARELDTLRAKYKEEYTKLGLHDAEANYRAIVRTTSDLNKRATDPKMSYLRVIEKASGNEVNIYMDTELPAGSKLAAKATTEDIKAALGSIRTARGGGLYNKAIKLNLYSENTELPAAIKSAVTDRTAGFTIPGSDYVNIYVDRLRTESANTSRPDGYWSTDITDLNSTYTHILSHEIGHLVEHDNWGGPGLDSSAALATDMEKFKAAANTTTTKVDATSANTTPAAPTDSAVIKQILDDQAKPVDLSSWTKTAGPAGSNPGGFYTNPATGEQIYMKFQQTGLHGDNERLASALYNAAGIESTVTLPGTFDGKPVTYSHIITGSKGDLTSHLNDKPYLEKIQRGFAMDALLANWDVVGNGQNNIMSDGSGNPIRVDPGGALLFRAQGKKKDSAFGNDVTELNTFLNPNMNSQLHGVYGSITTAKKLESARVVQKLSPANIDALVDGIVEDKAVAKQLKETLKNRRQDILARFNLSDSAQQAPAPSKATSNVSNSTEPVSTRGKVSASEEFAELYAKYAVTGDAPEWFVELLKSKGLTKRQISKKWRELEPATHQQILSVLDAIEAESSSSGVPERNNSDYGHHAKFGPADGHIIARLNGVTNNKPEVVAALDPSLKVVYRGVSPYGGKTAIDLHKEFITADKPYFSSTTYFGDGLYSATNFDTALGYADRKKTGVLTMAIKSDAKIFVYDESSSHRGAGTDRSNLLSPAEVATANNGIKLDSLRGELMNILARKVQNEMYPELDVNDPMIGAEVRKLAQMLPLGSAHSDQANWAGLLGYDAVEIVKSSGGSFFVFLNRGILQVVDI